jgi:putative ABC transport system permease protein
MIWVSTEAAAAPRAIEEINADIAACAMEVEALYSQLLPTAQEVVEKFNAGTSFEDLIAEYNASVAEDDQIEYTDYVALLMSSITSIISGISYVLVAFVSISLVVSSIMIGVITLISVQERTKEIGILRAIGASKRNVSSMFNAETVLIGLTSGLMGIGVSMLLCIPINAIIYKLTGLSGLQAYVPVNAGIILVIISVILSVFAGIIPSRSAARKDPVVALRTE